MKIKQKKKLQFWALSILLSVSVVSIILPHGSASYHSERTYYDDSDKSTDSGGLGSREARAQAFLNGTMWLEIASASWSWADAKGWVIWNFWSPYSLYNVQVSADFTAFGYVWTWYASAHLWFKLEVGGKSTEYYEWFGNTWTDEISRSKTISIDYGTMTAYQVYTIKATIRIHCENCAIVDLESNAPKPLGPQYLPNYEGFGE